MDNVTFIIVAFILSILLIVIVPAWLTNRAKTKVIEIFQTHRATSPDRARTLEQLGFTLGKVKAVLLYGRRDYKKRALKRLMKADVIKQLENGKLYLDETRLSDPLQ
jgi:hypothetical protein